MKFSLAAALSSLLLASTTVLSQRIAIGFPYDGAAVTAGSNITVEVDRPDTLTGSQEVAVVIGINSCRNTTCIPPDEILGSILYDGGYNPQFASNAPTKPPHQNFTVNIPSNLEKGLAQLAVFHVSLVGAGFAPFTEIQNVTVKVQYHGLRRLLPSTHPLAQLASCDFTNMKVLSFLIASVCVLSATAQRSFIGYPPTGASITPGKKFIVQIIRPNSIQGSTEAGLVIGLLSCANNPEGCPGPDVEVGTILYNKKLNPTIHPGEEDGPYENFTFTVPNDFPAGAAQLSTNRLHFIGAGPSPVLESNSVVLNVV
ncbi:hypothetical protein CVT26_012865 [Gymnopilus dilepis]|uniref:Phosphatidylglycerol/phosphatidylinositol transfer protein n=1 Tax=Gymnopilus dilepis TaxID=231916 RepID=A0A409YNU6_9AGAR|nr:hypothetical protein CVT26_012865 [Gymnopilus dilepis]